MKQRKSARELKVKESSKRGTSRSMKRYGVPRRPTTEHIHTYHKKLLTLLDQRQRKGCGSPKGSRENQSL